MTGRPRILGSGHYVPERIVPNSELEQHLALPEGWINDRTGVEARHYAAPDQAVSDLAYAASRMALEEAGVDGAEIDLVLLATSTPDHILPPTAPGLAHRLGSRGGAMDLAGACSGFLYAFSLAEGFLSARGGKALVVAANVLSRRINPDDRSSSILFGDAAGALVLDGDSPAEHGLLAVHLGARGEHYDLLKVPGGGSRKPFSDDMRASEATIHISDGGTAFAVAIDSMISTSRAVLEKAGLGIEDIDHWVPHQANRRIIEAARQRLRLPSEKVCLTIDRFGNSSAATIPLTLSHFRRTGRLKSGQTLLLTAVGAGFTEAAAVLRL